MRIHESWEDRRTSKFFPLSVRKLRQSFGVSPRTNKDDPAVLYRDCAIADWRSAYGNYPFCDVKDLAHPAID
jgi:hypothetical protein